MTLHHRKVDDHTRLQDGQQPLPVPAGWQIADGNADDVRVCGAHAWQSNWLVFANGDIWGTAAHPDPSYTGEARRAAKRQICLTPENRDKVGQRRLASAGCARCENEIWH